MGRILSLQQYLPFTVLKHAQLLYTQNTPTAVATVLTVYGIETFHIRTNPQKLALTVATVLTVYGIETI